MPRGRGLPKKYAKLGFKRGWAAYKKVHGGPRKRRALRTRAQVMAGPFNPSRRRISGSVARRKKGRRSRKGKIPLGITIGLGVAAWDLWNQFSAAPDELKGQVIMRAFTGYEVEELASANGREKGFRMEHLARFYGPIAGGYVVSTYVGGPQGLNVNAKLRGLPIVKL